LSALNSGLSLTSIPSAAADADSEVGSTNLPALFLTWADLSPEDAAARYRVGE
jgi:hypothetical protein